MALIECKECKAEISDQAESCPHCGYIEKKESSYIIWVIGIIAIPIGVLTYLSLGEKTTLDTVLMNETTQKIKKKIRDPESLLIGDHFFISKNHQGTPIIALCGDFKAKNGFGGYADSVRFASVGYITDKKISNTSLFIEDVKLSDDLRNLDMTPVFDDAVWQTYCIE